MARDARFWRNVAIIAGVHLLVFLGLARANRESDKPNLQSIVWMNAAETIAAAASPAAAVEEAAGPSAHNPAKAEPLPTSTAAKSEIVLPSPTPTATIPPKPRPTASPSPKSSPKPTEKPSPKPSPKKSVTPPPKPTPKASPKKEKGIEEKAKPPEEKKTSSKESGTPSDKPAEKSGSAGSGSGGTAKTSEHAWYGSMLHDRFYKAWQQPTTSVPTGAKMSTIVKIRIEKDGKVSKFAIVKPSGNVVVDESVSAIAERVTQVDPLPEGLTKNGFYEVKIDFELNAGN